MAVTRTDFVVAAGFDAPTLLGKLGEAIAHIGLMETPTSWVDSFSDAQGEYRVFTQTAGTGLRSTLYHMFFCKGGTTQLWYTNLTQYDVATHRSTGTQYQDYVRSYNWPGEISSGSWSSYFNYVAICSNASDFTFSTIENATGNFDAIWAHNAAESRVMGFITGTPTVDPDAPVMEDVSPPLSMMGVHESSIGVNFTSATNLKSNILTGFHDGGSTSSDYTPSNGTLGFAGGGGITEAMYYMGVTEACSSSNHFYGAAGANFTENIPDSFRASFQARLAYPFFQDVNSGDIGCISAHTDAFTPAAGDVLVVEAGVEEYLVFTTASGLDPGTYGNTWNSTVARIV